MNKGTKILLWAIVVAIILTALGGIFLHIFDSCRVGMQLQFIFQMAKPI